MQILIDYNGCTYVSVIMPHAEANEILEKLLYAPRALEIQLDSGELFFMRAAAINLATFRFKP